MTTIDTKHRCGLWHANHPEDDSSYCPFKGDWAPHIPTAKQNADAGSSISAGCFHARCCYGGTEYLRWWKPAKSWFLMLAGVHPNGHFNGMAIDTAVTFCPWCGASLTADGKTVPRETANTTTEPSQDVSTSSNASTTFCMECDGTLDDDRTRGMINFGPNDGDKGICVLCAFRLFWEYRQTIAEAWKVLGVTAAGVADDCEVATLPGAIRASLQYERDRYEQMVENSKPSAETAGVLKRLDGVINFVSDYSWPMVKANLAHVRAAVEKLAAENARLTQEAANTIKLAQDIEAKWPRVRDELTAERDRLAAENKALRGALHYARTKRGAAFDFDEWERLTEAAMNGNEAPNALENEQGLNATLHRALKDLRDKNARLKASEEQAREAVLRAGRDPKWAATYAWLDEHHDAAIKSLSDTNGRLEVELKKAKQLRADDLVTAHRMKQERDGARRSLHDLRAEYDKLAERLEKIESLARLP